jgi:hypothetical protein
MLEAKPQNPRNSFFPLVHSLLIVTKAPQAILYSLTLTHSHKQQTTTQSCASRGKPVFPNSRSCGAKGAERFRHPPRPANTKSPRSLSLSRPSPVALPWTRNKKRRGRWRLRIRSTGQSMSSSTRGQTSQTLSCSTSLDEEHENIAHATNADSGRRWVDVFFYTGQTSQTLTLHLATSLDNDDQDYYSETNSDDSFGSIIVGSIFASPDTPNWADDMEEAFQAARPATALGVYEPVDYE